ncbi:hypothetical protein KY320_02580 [Candidatus Woesearchaeota archaeon]|nr:hypothetical protein [Candidatus Woesearchaeota archaeon]
MLKRGQITIFIVVAIVIALSFGMLFLLKSELMQGIIQPERDEALMLQSEQTSLRLYAEQCFEDAVHNSYQHNCFDSEDCELDLAAYITADFRACVDLEPYRARGIDAEMNNGDVNVDINDNVINVVSDYEFSLSAGTSLVSVSDFVFSVERPITFVVPTTGGMLREPFRATTADGLMEVEFAPGTVFTNALGNVVDNPEISIYLASLTYEDATIHGYRIYQFEPSGMKLSEPLTIKLQYDDGGMGAAEETLIIVKRDGPGDIWRKIDTEVYPEQNLAIGYMDSFSEAGLSITCGAGGNTKIFIDTEFMYVVGCEPCLCFVEGENGAWYAPDYIKDGCADDKSRCGIDEEMGIKKFEEFEKTSKPKGGTTAYVAYKDTYSDPNAKDIFCNEYCKDRITPEDVNECKTKCKTDWDDGTLAGCQLHDWDGDGDNELGYPGMAAAGGEGEFSFELINKSEGDTICINSINISNIFVDDSVSIFNLNNQPIISISGSIQPNDLLKSLQKGGVIKALANKVVEGKNNFTIKVINNNGVCSYARMLFMFEGTGLTCKDLKGSGKCCEFKGEVTADTDLAAECGFPVNIEVDEAATAGINVRDEDCGEVKAAAVNAKCNKFGFMTLAPEDTQYVHTFSGDGGWILRTFGVEGKIWGDDNTAPESAPSFVISARNMKLNPIVRIVGPPGDEANIDIRIDDNKYVIFIKNLLSSTSGPLYVQIGNEPNNEDFQASGKKDPAQYAEMINKIHQGLTNAGIRDKVYIITAGLSPSKPDSAARDVYAKTIIDNLNREAFDIWGHHSYPSWTDAGANPKSYDRPEIRALEKPILITESGQGVHNLVDGRCMYDDKDITKGAKEAFRIWNTDSQVIGTTIFILLDTNSPERACTSWIGANRADESQWRPQYNDLRVGGPGRDDIGEAVCGNYN